MHKIDINKYRIKPDEPDESEFKVGDWVVIKPTGRIKLITVRDSCHKDRLYDDISGNFFSFKGIELWKPQYEEICVFWNDNKYYMEYYIGRYDTECSDDLRQAYFNKDEWDNVAPLEFINTLKD